MRTGMMRFFTVANVLLAVGLVGSAIWLYGREHDTRRLEREIRSLQRATALEEETIRRLEIEWQRLRNPMRLEALARLKLNLLPPDPVAVMPQGQALDMLPLRPPPALEEGASAEARDALSGLAAQAAGEPQAAEETQPQAAATAAAVPAPAMRGEQAGAPVAPAQQDVLGGLIRNILPPGDAEQGSAEQ